MSSLAFSDSFEYLCYGSTAIRRQILTTKVDPRAVRVINNMINPLPANHENIRF